MPYAVKEGPDPDGDVEEHGLDVSLLHVIQELGEAGHGLEGNQVVGVVFVIHAVDHGRQELGPVLPHLRGKRREKRPRGASLAGGLAGTRPPGALQQAPAPRRASSQKELEGDLKLRPPRAKSLRHRPVIARGNCLPVPLPLEPSMPYFTV